MVVYYHAGGWDAFSGPADNGKPVCGIGIDQPGRQPQLLASLSDRRRQRDVPGEEADMEHPAGTPLPVVVQIGLNAPWNMQGVGNGQMVEWSLDRKRDADLRCAVPRTPVR